MDVLLQCDVTPTFIYKLIEHGYPTNQSMRYMNKIFKHMFILRSNVFIPLPTPLPSPLPPKKIDIRIYTDSG